MKSLLPIRLKSLILIPAILSFINISLFPAVLFFEMDYLGEKKPGTAAELFAPGVVSTGLSELNAAFSPDGNEFYFAVRSGWSQMVICSMKKEGNKWSSPEMASFSGKGYLDADPFFSHDGKMLYFCSNRPAPGRENSTDWNIWMVKKTNGTWGEPEYLPFNTPKNEMYVSISKKGSVYFHADYENKTERTDLNQTDIYCSEFNGRDYLPAVKLPGINSPNGEWDPLIAPDESFIIFTSVRPGGFGSGDLYISFRQSDGSWGGVKNMGDKINSPLQDYCPNLSPDGKYFFFTSFKAKPAGKLQTYQKLVSYLNGPQNGTGGDIYWIESTVIDQLR